MVGFLFRRMLLPLILWFPIVVLPTTLIPAEYAEYRLLPGLLYTTWLLYWWLTGIGRFVARRWRWVTVGYLLTNFAIGLALTGLLFATGVVMTLYNQTIGATLGFLSFVVGLGWFLWSLAHLARHGQRRRKKSLLWRLLGDWLEETFEETPPKKEPPAKPQPAKAQRPPAATRPPAASSPAASTPRAASKQVYIPVGAGEDATTIPGVAIPSRSSTSRMVGNDAADFVQQAQAWVLRQEYVGNYAPFESYYPTYRQMSFEQQQWYFYWRTQLRQGKFLATDLSYLFVYVYELLNVVGVTSPTDARDRLVTFWQFYRTLQPKLDTYLVDWVADFNVLHNLSESALAWYAHALREGATSRNTETLQLEAWHQQGRDYDALPATTLYELANYATQQNKFYQAYQNELALDEALKRGVAVIDGYVQQSQRLSLYELHLPMPTQTVMRPPLQGALHAYPTTPIVIGRVRPWLSEATLQDDLKQILRYTENILRTQAAFKTKLRGVTLPPAWATVLDQAFVKTPPKRVVSIDLAGAAALQRESDELRQRLLNTGETAPDALAPDDVALTLQPVTPSGDLSTIQRPDDAPAGLLTDLPALTAIMGNASSEATVLLRALRDAEWQSQLLKLGKL